MKLICYKVKLQVEAKKLSYENQIKITGHMVKLANCVYPNYSDCNDHDRCRTQGILSHAVQH